MDHLAEMLEGLSASLEMAGMEDVGYVIRMMRTDTHNLEQIVHVLDTLGPALTKAYVRAEAFARKVPSKIRPDAEKYKSDLFTARCHVAATREAAKRILHGDTLLN